jgi:sugar lactone lactonase YvrE
MRRKIKALVGIAAALSLIVTATVLADGGKGKKKGPKPKAASLITVPGTAVFPEGIAARGKSVYTGSSGDGTIFRARAKAGETATVFAAPADGRTAALGMKFDKSGHLVVAGGATGKVFVLDANTGATVGVYSNAGVYAPGGPTFLNDIAIAKNGDAYVTDSFAAVLYRIPAAALAAPTMTGSLEGWLPLSGSPIVYQAGFNLNGIVAKKNKYLVVVQTNTGKLFRISIANKAITEIAVKGTTLTGGDGMILDDERLYVVHQGVVDVLKVKSNFKKAAKLRKTITDPTFDSPTTAALAKGRLFVVNSQFGRPSTGVYAAGAPFTISVVKPGKGKH